MKNRNYTFATAYLLGDVDAIGKEPTETAFGEACNLPLILGLGGGGFICIARSVAARLSDNNDGDTDFGSTFNKYKICFS